MMRKIVRMINCCTGEIKRCFASWNIVIAIVLYLIFIFIVSQTQGSNGAYQSIRVMTSMNNLNRVLILISAFPVVTLFCNDWKNKYTVQLVLRSNVRQYCISKIFACFAMAFIVTFIGLLTYGLFCEINYGAGMNEYSVSEGDVYYQFYNTGMRFGCAVMNIVFFALVSGVYAVFGLTLTSFIPNAFVAATSPIIFIVIVEELGTFIPKAIDLFSIQSGNRAFYYAGAMGIVILSILVCLAYIVLAGYIFQWNIGRRVRGDSV